MPLSWPYWLRAVSRVAGDMASPLIETASPLSKPMVMTVGVSGASSGEIVR